MLLILKCFFISERLIRQYFGISRKTIQDMVPKAIMKFLVNKVQDSLHSELIASIYEVGNIDDIVHETKAMVQQRKSATEMLDALKKAKNVIEEIRNSD